MKGGAGEAAVTTVGITVTVATSSWVSALGGGDRPTHPPAYYGPPPVVLEEPPVYIEPPQGAQPGSGMYWYYCPSAHGYYPQVPSCQEPWIRVPPTTN